MASRDTSLGGGSTPYQPLQSTQVQSAQPGYTSMSVPAGAFDQGASGLVRGGQQLGEFGDKMEQLALKMQQEDNEAAAREADIKVADTIRSVVWGSPDKPGYFGTKGKDALDNYGAAEDAINSAIGDAMKNAPNDMVAKMLQRTLAARRQGVLEQMNAHAGHQRNQYMDGLNEARQASAASDAALAWNNNQSIETSLGIIKGEAENMATRNGMGSVEPPKEGEQPSAAYVGLRQAQSKAIQGAFDAALASGAFDRAKEIMVRYGSYLDGQTSTTMEKRIRLEQEVQENKRKQAENEYQSNLQDAMFNKLVAGNLTTADIANSGLKGRSKYQFMQLLERQATAPQDIVHPVLFNDLGTRIYLPDSDPRKVKNEEDINDYISSGQLSINEGRELRKYIQELRKPDDIEAKKYGATAAKEWGRYLQMGHNVLVKTNAMGMTDPDGAVNFYNWQAQQRIKWEAGISAGKDPLDMLNPASKDYIGTPVQKTPQQIMQEQAERMRSAKGIADQSGGVPDDKKRRPGESVDDYMKRTGMK